MSPFTTSQHLAIGKYYFWNILRLPSVLDMAPLWTECFKAFTKLGKATVGFVLFFRPHGATRLPLAGFSKNFLLVF